MSASVEHHLSFACGEEIAVADNEPRTLVECIARRIEARPAGLARSYSAEGVQSCSYEELWRKAGDLAAALAGAGCHGKPVVVLADDILDFLPSFWGCFRAAAIPVALMAAAKDAIHRGEPSFDQAVSLLHDPIVLTDETFADLLASRSPRQRIMRLANVSPVATSAVCHPACETAYLVATSGATGRLKLVELSQSAAIFRNYARRGTTAGPDPFASTDVLGTFPLDSVTGQHPAFIHQDAITQISPQLLMARPNSILDAIETFQITQLTLTNTMINRILAAEEHARTATRYLGSLRSVGLGAEPISAALIQAFAALLKRSGADPDVLVAGYGTSETGSLVVGSRALLTSAGSEPVCLGRPWHGVSMRVVSEDGEILSAGKVGALEILCPAKMFTRYWGDDALSAESFTADGWWKTGDLGQLTDGEIILHGRAKDVVIQNGRKLPLAEMDRVIQAALGVGSLAHCCFSVDPDTREERIDVAFEPIPGMPEASAVDSINSALVRRFGIRPRRVKSLAAIRFPRTAAGKVRRQELSRILGMLHADVEKIPIRPLSASGPVNGKLAAIWSDVLGLRRPAQPDDDFFALGGDSLRALALHIYVADTFGVRITAEEFFDAPTLATLMKIVEAHRLGEREDEVPGTQLWSLPARLQTSMAFALSQWPGERATEDSLILGFNRSGALPPIFWVFNVPSEPLALAQALGDRQPLYAMRSGLELSDYREDDIQAFALCYVAEIEHLCPTGPIFIGGNCQGGIIALAIAQHLLRRKRHVPLLILMDWSFELQAYPGRVLLISGDRNHNHNARSLFAQPEFAWRRAFAETDFVQVSGGYAQGFEPGRMQRLRDHLAHHMGAALATAPRLLPLSGYHAEITAAGIPVAMRAGERHTIDVSIVNASEVTWAPTSISGIRVSSHWARQGKTLQLDPQPRCDLPGLAPGQMYRMTLEIVAPSKLGQLGLKVDLVEEGSRWFGSPSELETIVQVSGRNVTSRLLHRLGLL